MTQMKTHCRILAHAAALLIGATIPALAVPLPANVRLLPAMAGMPRPATAPSVAPQITSGSVVSTSLTVGSPGAVPEISFGFLTGSAGLQSVSFTFTSPNGAVNNTATYYAGAFSQSGEITFSGSSVAPFYSQPGIWALTQISITDNGGGFTQYSADQIRRIFRNTRYTLVNNGPVDLTPPTVETGKVLSPTVSLSSPDPQFAVHMTGIDNLSGLAVAYVFIAAPGAPFSNTYASSFAFPRLSAGVDAVVPLFPGSATGTYTITGYEMCDVAGNCLIDQSAADVQKLFGTTSFTVTS